MGTQGGYGCRLTKQGSKCGPLLSIHSYGFAADLTFDGFTDVQNDQCFHAPLLDLFPYMVKRGVIWGMTFNFEDSHHWEISEQTGRSWLANGKPKPGGTTVPAVPQVDRCRAAFADGVCIAAADCPKYGGTITKGYCPGSLYCCHSFPPPVY